MPDLVPVDYNPFSPAGVQLTPVEHDPFAAGDADVAAINAQAQPQGNSYPTAFDARQQRLARQGLPADPGDKTSDLATRLLGGAVQDAATLGPVRRLMDANAVDTANWGAPPTTAAPGAEVAMILAGIGAPMRVPKLTPVDHEPFAVGSDLRSNANMISSAPMKSSALSDSELDNLASSKPFPNDLYIHNSPNKEIDFNQGGGNYGNAFFVQRKEPYGQPQYGPNVHAFEMKGNVLHVGDEKMENEIRNWLESTDARGQLPEAYEDLIHRQHNGDHAAAASQLADELRNVDLIDTEHSLMDMGEHLSAAGYHGVRTNDAALLFDPSAALRPLRR